MVLHRFRHWLRNILRGIVAASSLLIAPRVSAQVYGGCGLLCGINNAGGIEGLSQTTSLSELILMIISFVLDITLLLAVIAIIIAGIYLITSNGEEGQKDKAKKIIFYAIIGIILILLSRVIVLLVNSLFS